MLVFVNCLLVDILKPINIVAKQPQSSSQNLVTALSIAKAVREELKGRSVNFIEAQWVKVIADFRKGNQLY